MISLIETQVNIGLLELYNNTNDNLVWIDLYHTIMSNNHKKINIKEIIRRGSNYNQRRKY